MVAKNYMVTIGGKPVFTNLTEQEAKSKCGIMLALSPRVDIFYSKMKGKKLDKVC